MASSAATEAIEVRRRGRRRLVGAIAIVALLVVFVPMFFDSETSHEPAEPTIQIPSPDKVKPLPPPAPAKAAPAAVTPAQAGAQSSPQATVTPATVTPATVTPATVTPAQPAGQSPPRLEGFAVQVGAYRDDKTLSETRARLTAAGIAHYIERLEGSQAGLTRLRAGPFKTREAAEKARAELKLANLDGQVVPLP